LLLSELAHTRCETLTYPRVMGERINAAWELAVRKGPLCPRFVPMRWNDLWGNGAGERLESLAFSSPCRWRGSSFGVVQFGIDVLTIIHRQVALFDLALCAGRRDVGGATTDRLQSRLSVRIPPAPPMSPYLRSFPDQDAEIPRLASFGCAMAPEKTSSLFVVYHRD
jgi:hypothetical protein